MVGSVFIDLKKGFDTVDHDLLCKKSEHCVILQRASSWSQSYFYKRRQYNRVEGGGDSSTGKIESGVLQG